MNGSPSRASSGRIVVYGAGAVGLAVSAGLSSAGIDVLVVARRGEVARRIASHGIEVRDPSSGQLGRARPAAAGLAALRTVGDAPVLLGMRRGDLDPALRDLAQAAPGALAVTLQNDVDCEERAARLFPRVIGVVVRKTATRTAPNAVTAFAGGRLVLGPHPSGRTPESAALAEVLRSAGYDVGESERIAEDKWLKLAVNLMSGPNALVRRDDHATAEFVGIKVRLLEEARAIFDAAGIVAHSCDGRDRSLVEEIAYHRASLARGTSARSLPLYNQVWQALRHGGSLEADGYHRRVLALAETHGLAAPQNRRVLEALLDARRHARGPESLAAADLLADG
jgi:2-dehydropantoate 2-reductase